MNASSNSRREIGTRENLLHEMQKGWRPTWLFFWGHQPAKNGFMTSSCFSQWWSGHPFTVNSIRYATAEHYMMAEKARLFDDAGTLDSILEAKSAAVAKKLGRQVKGFDESRWLQARWGIVVQGNLAKFSQHNELRDFLIQTGDRVLVEASPFDRIWGIGMAATTEGVENPARWKGLNLLGFALMEVRHQMRAEAKIL